MKSKQRFEPVKWLSRYDSPNRRGGSFPRVEVHFQAPRGGPPEGGAWFGGARKRGFSRLAGEVLRADASRSFRLETAVLGFLSLVAAWPVAIMIHEVIRLLK